VQRSEMRAFRIEDALHHLRILQRRAPDGKPAGVRRA
jgi:hypothetical protein